eukprot:SAG31_NODE_46618_length_253_cov_1.344156_1_plen_84_part_11
MNEVIEGPGRPVAMLLLALRAAAAALLARGGPAPHPQRWTPGDAGRSACHAGFDEFPFCNSSLPLALRVHDLIKRIPDAAKPNL